MKMLKFKLFWVTGWALLLQYLHTSNSWRYLNGVNLYTFFNRDMLSVNPLYPVIISLIFITSCSDDEKCESACPDIDDNITWTSYNDLVFENSGNDSCARKIISQCEWHVHNNHNGGVGETLQVASPGEEVILVWAFNDFHGFKVSQGWTGSTQKNINIGDHITSLYAEYPEFTTNDGVTHILEQGDDIRVKLTTNINGFVDDMTVGFYFRQ